MTAAARTSEVDGVVAETALGAVAVRHGSVEVGEHETAVLVIAGTASGLGVGIGEANGLGVGDGVHGPAELTGDARFLVLTSRHPAPPQPRTWRFAPAGAGTDEFLDNAGGFTDMGVRWLATTATLGTRGLVVATSTFAPGGHHEPHRHPHADEFFLVVRGGGYHHAPDGPIRLDPGDLVHVPAGEPHGFATDPGTVTTALYGYLGAGSLDQAGYEVGGAG
ncbi:cupin domain-containing protein [Saccharothrix variisporea]|uniref:Cupin domain n=1 Tax=Saccharothrix variisporea TaxID=543527 RepID=A0A495XM67_9PSEU|nr:cupin domain-containing protein [Saccharothrix variisporea]RKT72698.1 cupin domain [Saccharothrix variisporea]